MKFKTTITKTLSAILLLLIAVVCSSTVQAKEIPKENHFNIENDSSDPVGEINYVSTNNILVYASVNRRTISADVSITAMNTNTPYDGTISIQKSEKGSWKPVAKWRFAGKGAETISKKYSGKRATYRVYVCGKVGSDRITCYSSEISVK